MCIELFGFEFFKKRNDKYIIKKEVISHFSFLGVLKQFLEIYPVVERYRHLKREKRKRSIQSWLSLKQRVFVLSLAFLPGNASEQFFTGGRDASSIISKRCTSRFNISYCFFLF